MQLGAQKGTPLKEASLHSFSGFEWVTSHPRPPNPEELQGKGSLPSASCVLLSGARSRPYPNLDPTPARLSCFRSPRWTLHLSDSLLGTGQTLPTLIAARLGGPLSSHSRLFKREERSFSQPPKVFRFALASTWPCLLPRDCWRASPLASDKIKL